IATHIFHLVVNDDLIDWAAARLGIDDRERIRTVLSGVLVTPSHMRHAEHIVEVLENQDIATRVGNGWELCERVKEREEREREAAHEREHAAERAAEAERERERQAMRSEQDTKDEAEAREWLDKNDELVT